MQDIELGARARCYPSDTKMSGRVTESRPVGERLEDGVVALERDPEAPHALVERLAAHAEEVGSTALVAARAVERGQELRALVERAGHGEAFAARQLVEVDDEVVGVEQRTLAAQGEGPADAVLE